MTIKISIWAVVFLLGCAVAIAQRELPGAAVLPSVTGLLDSLAGNMLKKIPLDSMLISVPDSSGLDVPKGLRKSIDPILTFVQKHGRNSPGETSFRVPPPNKGMGKAKILDSQKHLYQKIQPKLPDLEEAAFKLQKKKADLGKFSGSEKYRNGYEKILDMSDSLSEVQPDSLVMSLLADAEEKAASGLMSEFGPLPAGDANLADGTAFIQQGTSTGDFKSDRIMEKSRQANHFVNRDLADVHREKLDALKKKYAGVPDSRDLDSLAKKSSLAHLSFPERLEYGLMLRNPAAKPVRFDLNGFVGFRVNKLLAVGGGAWMAMMPEKDGGTGYAGFSLYALHRVHKSLFATGGYDLARSRHSPPGEKGTGIPQFWAGLGSETAVFRRLVLRSQVTYRLSQLAGRHREDFRSPWAVTLGIVHFK